MVHEMKTLALDVYGTLINPHALSTRLSNYLGEQADAFSQTWRTKQLEFSFRRGLMRKYADFSVVTRDALEYADVSFGSTLSANAKTVLLDEYSRLEAYAGVPEELARMRMQGRSLYAFSNGVPGQLESLMKHAGIADLLDGIISVHDVRSFKPDPKVYEHFNHSTNTLAKDTTLVSSNAFDICGAQACGWNTAWLKRDSNTIFDTWGDGPDLVIESLNELLG